MGGWLFVNAVRCKMNWKEFMLLDRTVCLLRKVKILCVHHYAGIG